MKANGKEIAWWPSWLMAGICLTSICLSLVCLAHLLFMQNHSCGCVKHSEASYKERGESPVIATASSPLNSMENLSQQRQRRNVVQNPGSFSLYQLQTQIMMIETRFRLLQEEVKRRQGTLGRRGPSGPPGRAGRDGMDGRPGMDGPMGLPGRDGHDGKDGSPGPSGPPGPPGVNGLQGARGERGIKGEPGPMGDKGEIGLPGPKGDRGPRGEAGENGEPGVSGRSGAKGEKGSSGEAKCYVTENGRRFPKPCYLAAHASSDSDLNGHTKTSSGVIFYRWGRTACPQGSTEIYSGQAGSVTHGTRRPGGSEYKCIPSKPWYFGQRDQSSPIRNATTISVEGEGALRASQYYLTCVACLSSKHSIQIMLPARKECYRKWHRQYDGFLAVQVNRGDQKELVCIDRDARALFDTPDYIMALRADCNTFSCPPFTNSERLPCVVCTM